MSFLEDETGNPANGYPYSACGKAKQAEEEIVANSCTYTAGEWDHDAGPYHYRRSAFF